MLSQEFTIKTRGWQGAVASLLLFNIINAIMHKAFKGGRGVQSVIQFLTDVMLTDDSAIFAKDNTVATDILYNIPHISQPHGLKISAEKMKVVTTDGSPVTVLLKDVQIKQVQKFKYLSSLLKRRL